MTPNRRPIDLAEYDDAHLATNAKQAIWEEPLGPGVEPMLTTTIRLPKTVLDALRSAAAARGVKVTTLMREWLGERLAQANAAPDAAIPVSALLALVAERATPQPHASPRSTLPERPLSPVHLDQNRRRDPQETKRRTT